jgi:hypothetical protein
MSLRTFHLFFISVSSLLCLFLVFWGLWDFKSSGAGLGLGLCILGVVGLVLLVQYFRWFRQKSFKVLPLALGLAAGSWMITSPSFSQACSVCYGDPNSSLSKGAIWGVWVLLAVVVTVLSLIVLQVRSWLKRAKDLSVSF